MPSTAVVGKYCSLDYVNEMIKILKTILWGTLEKGIFDAGSIHIFLKTTHEDHQRFRLRRFTIRTSLVAAFSKVLLCKGSDTKVCSNVRNRP